MSFNLNALVQTRFNGRGGYRWHKKPSFLISRKRGTDLLSQIYDANYSLSSLPEEYVHFTVFYDRFLRSINTYSCPYKSAAFSPVKRFKLSDISIFFFFRNLTIARTVLEINALSTLWAFSLTSINPPPVGFGCFEFDLNYTSTISIFMRDY